MTNEEAIKIFTESEKCFCKHGAYKDCNSRCKYREALELAIKALEPKIGHWIEHDTTFGRNIYYCTACGRSIEILYKYDFCPLCGADMRGDSE